MRRRALAALLATGLMLAGCSDDTAAEPDEPHELAPSQPPVEDPVVTVDTYPAVVDPAVLEDAPDAGTRLVVDEAAQVAVAWPDLGLAPVDTVLAERVRAGVAAYRTAHPAPAAGTPSTSELNGTWSLVGSAPDVAGVLLDTSVHADGTTTDTWATTWYDARDAAVVPNSALLADPARFADAVTEALAGQDAVDPVSLTTVLAAGVPVLAFTENGELFVGFDGHQLAGGRTGRITVVLPVEATDELLSPLGERARDALVEPTLPPAPDGAVPAPGGEASGGTASAEATGTTEPTEPTGTGEPAEPAVDCAVERCVALTFDDGPGPGSADLLAALEAVDAPATFFVVGQQVATYPDATAAIAAAGHEIGVHTWDHKNLTRLGGRHVEREIDRTATAIEDATGTAPVLFRPPYGATDPGVLARAGAAGLAQVLWSVDPDDAAPVELGAAADAAELTRRVLDRSRPGDVVLLHEQRPATLAALPGIVAGLRERGLVPVTVSTLLGTPEPGVTYTQRPTG
ncbi:polysaccharide deacetylase family protein [Nocardioides sp. ChNu-153]|uniref:polysaccharide deacetylase family protein n=1 Tax=unclassified Nocardioides TaxID=2615069 RepID=UPI0024056E26|nr:MULTISPECIES: polysaccharide deacetylase family protein [unclassified Nocardioides]MDF9714964.1 polysaccharide deacetylase family protein [Nocardioides sp. ChNu-99]MDN7122439.1 polysaccharide deacetylase family protein [Nocardioides sp. ChNu-153]